MEANTVYKNLVKYLIGCKEKLKNASPMEQYQIIEEIYLRLKIDSLVLFSQSLNRYKRIFDLLFECEKLVGGLSIMPSTESIIKVHNIFNEEDLLNYVVYQVRTRIVKAQNEFNKIYLKEPSHLELDQIDLTNKCQIVSLNVLNECKKMGIKCRIVKIAPGFNDKEKLYAGNGEHYFNIIEINGKSYLIDLTYKQFFNTDMSNILSRMGIVKLLPCSLGTYMTIDNERRSLATTLINKGWIKLNTNSLKRYCDGFTLSVRNGLYYEIIGNVNYQTEYTDDDYYDFLNGKDDLFKHEPREGLGIQMRPLKNPYIRFNIK